MSSTDERPHISGWCSTHQWQARLSRMRATPQQTALPLPNVRSRRMTTTRHHTRAQMEAALLAAELAAWNAEVKAARQEYQHHPIDSPAVCDVCGKRSPVNPCVRCAKEEMVP